MATIKNWISAFRPRTLFLAVATTLCGSGMALSVGKFDGYVFILTMLTATILQLLSNLANDYGDYQHGTDITGERVGPTRTLQSGAITSHQMKIVMYITVATAMIVGAGLVYIALQFMSVWYIILFLLLGAASIVAAIRYTAGKNPYGYKGLGDLFSFVFFGPVSVVGTYFLHTHTMGFRPWLPAIALGFFTVCVLNINNMRDIENDRKSGKITIPVRLGLRKAKLYHAVLTLGAIACFVVYSLLYSLHWYQHLYLLVALLFFKILSDIFHPKEGKALDPYLKYTSLSACILSILFCICINA